MDGEIREQIQRTVHVKGVNPQTTSNAALLEYMQEHAGEVKYSTFAGEGDFVEECEAYVEFADIKGVIGALKLVDPKIGEKDFTVSFAFRKIQSINIGLGRRPLLHRSNSLYIQKSANR